jgi:hypothetical protein
MKRFFLQKLQFAAFFPIVLFVIISCSAPIKLESSWTKRQAKVKSSPLIMVMVLGNPDSEARHNFEYDMIARLKKNGFKALPASDFIKPAVSKPDSAGLVKILRDNNVDMLLTNALIDIKEKERFIPGTVQGGPTEISTNSYANSSVGYYGGYAGYNNYYNYYSAYSSYHTVDAPPVKGVTVTDVEVIIESNLFEVATPERIWHGQSRSYTKEPTKKLIKTFTKIVVEDIMKNNLLVK